MIFIDSVLDILGQLKDAGITQYHFVPFYQGCTQTDESIQYAITLGEPQLVPRHVPNVINIGNRIIDISTIHDLCTCFQLPSSLTNQITRTYVNRILQIIQLTGTHYTNYVFSQQLLQAVISNLNVSICLMTDEGPHQHSEPGLLPGLEYPGKRMHGQPVFFLAAFPVRIP